MSPRPKRRPMITCGNCGRANDPDRGSKKCWYCGEDLPSAGADRAPRTIRSRADAIAAGRAHARARGDRLTPEQIVRLAALIRPHLDGNRAA
jgi:hypothetical protein